MSLDGLPPAHLRVLLDGLPVFERYGLLLAGGYAFRAHEIVHRPSQDLDFATSDDTPLPEIAAHVRDAFQRAGYGVRLAEAASPRYARLVLQLPRSGEELEMDLLKEALEPRWAVARSGPVGAAADGQQAYQELDSGGQVDRDMRMPQREGAHHLNRHRARALHHRRPLTVVS